MKRSNSSNVVGLFTYISENSKIDDLPVYISIFANPI